MIKFDVEKTVNYWCEGAEYDMDVADAMYEKKKYPYALFTGHLALEKLLKAVVVRMSQQHAPLHPFVTLISRKVSDKDLQKDNEKTGKVHGISF